MNHRATNQFVAASSLVPTCEECGEVMQFTAGSPLIPLASLGSLRYRCPSCGERKASPDAAVSRC
jgi:RNase P subunit RPR2